MKWLLDTVFQYTAGSSTSTPKMSSSDKINVKLSRGLGYVCCRPWDTSKRPGGTHEFMDNMKSAVTQPGVEDKTSTTPSLKKAPALAVAATTTRRRTASPRSTSTATRSRAGHLPRRSHHLLKKQKRSRQKRRIHLPPRSHPSTRCFQEWKPRWPTRGPAHSHATCQHVKRKKKKSAGVDTPAFFCCFLSPLGGVCFSSFYRSFL